MCLRARSSGFVDVPSESVNKVFVSGEVNLHISDQSKERIAAGALAGLLESAEKARALQVRCQLSVAITLLPFSVGRTTQIKIQISAVSTVVRERRTCFGYFKGFLECDAKATPAR